MNRIMKNKKRTWNWLDQWKFAFLFWLYRRGFNKAHMDKNYHMWFAIEQRKSDKMRKQDAQSYRNAKKKINIGLRKNKDRNMYILVKINHVDTLHWIIKYIKNDSGSHDRNKEGDSVFNAHLHLSGLYNAIMMLLSNDSPENSDAILEQQARWFLDEILKNKKIIDDSKWQTLKQ